MIVHTHHLKSATTPVTISPIGDIQWAGDEDDIAYDHLNEHIGTCLEQPGPLFIGMGDYVDFASPSNRERLQHARLYDTAKRVIADATKSLVDDVYNRVLKPTRGKWLGLVEGHHHHEAKIGQLKDGTATFEDSDVYLAKLLQAKWLEEMGLVKLMFPGGGVFRVLAFHGSGASVFPWGPLIKLYRLMPHFHVDLLLMGHQTKKADSEVDRLVFPDDSDEPRHMIIKMVGTGGWSKGYINGRRTYVSAGALGPVALGQPIIRLKPRVRKGVWDPVLTVES